MINDSFILQSPKDNYNEDYLDEDEAIFKVFQSSFDKRDMQDDFDMDYLYYLNNQNSKDLVPGKESENLVSNESSLLLMDDYEAVYDKFVGVKDPNMIKPEENISNKPLFYFNFDKNQNKFKSPINQEKEEMIVIEILNEFNKDKTKDLSTNPIEESKIVKKKGKDKTKALKENGKTQKRHRRKKYCRETVDTEDKCFPFTTGKGIISFSCINDEFNLSNTECTSSPSGVSQASQSLSSKKEILGMQDENMRISNNNNEEISNYIDQIINTNDFDFKFVTKKYYISSDGKKKRVKKKRKYKPDDIRKKIKVRFHKTLKNIINQNLKKVCSKEFFDFLPQCFLSNVTKKTNAKFLELSLKELLSTDFLKELNKEDYRNSKIDFNKYKKNKEVLRYLEENPDISERSGFDAIKDKKYKDILKNYFTSAQFEESLYQLKEENENPEYIIEYIKKAKTYISFYCNVKYKEEDEDEDENENEEEDEEEKNNDEN